MAHHEKPGTPGDILEQSGVKGMHWGERHDDESLPKETAQRNETKKRNIAITKKDSSSTTKKVESSSGLSPTQKKAIFAAGVGVVAIGGFVAYKHYTGGSAPKPVGLTDWGNPMPTQPDMSALKTRRLSKKPLGALGKEGDYALFRQDKLKLNTANGYADWLPKGGFANEHVAARHDSMIRAVEAMREKYPAIRNMNIEVAPMSHKYRDPRDASEAIGLASSLGRGEARVYYDDISGHIKTDMSSFIPGFRDPDQLGTHEMGHVLASAHGALMSVQDRNAILDKAAKVFDEFHAADDIHQAEGEFHRRLFQKHGISFSEIAGLGGYAGSSSVEGLAELSANYHAPGLRAKMDPDLARRAKSLFDDIGGVS